ncbi:hypothetical protein TeGR_g15072, partial [Tetraparma gracilis]
SGPSAMSSKSGSSTMSSKSGSSTMSGKSGPSAMSGKSGPSAMSGKSGPSAMGMGMGMGMYGVAPELTCSDAVGDAALRAFTKDCEPPRAAGMDCAYVAAIDGGCEGFVAFADSPPRPPNLIRLELNSGLDFDPWCALSTGADVPWHAVAFSAADMREKCCTSCPA